jgi:hypothetical protein
MDLRMVVLGGHERRSAVPLPAAGRGQGPRSGPGQILDAAPQSGRAWAEAWGNLQLDQRLTGLMPVRHHYAKCLVALSSC